MATLTIRNVPDDVKRELRIAAAKRGVSMEQEARDRLSAGSRDIPNDPPRKAKALTTTRIREMADQMSRGEPLDPHYKRLSQKELSDMVFDGEL